MLSKILLFLSLVTLFIVVVFLISQVFLPGLRCANGNRLKGEGFDEAGLTKQAASENCENVDLPIETKFTNWISSFLNKP